VKVEQGGGRVVVAWCEQGRADGPWEMNGQQLRHTKLGRCLALNPDTRELAMQSCREENQYQAWEWKEVTPHWARNKRKL